ncbi:MAG: hypothetical protein CME04_07605 [Gemmatimonadaceae bacterium]|jgi:hypothetical protein|nr:hypothetical protein [Gemmatimonadaceae bacterium]|tara:strand:- start:375 stop:800 length:426 start_codon:yes stop_codon:yes gene_type:complete
MVVQVSSASNDVTDTRLTRRRPLRLLLLAAGTLALVCGVVGIFLPLVPTTPFLLLAAWCYARGSDRFYRRLLANRWLGPYIRNFREGRGLTLWAKVSTIAVLWLAISIAAGFVAPAWWSRLLLVGIAAAVTTYLLRMPTCR